MIELWNNIIAYWSSLVFEQQLFVCIAIPATVIMIIQIITMLVGLGGGTGDIDGADADVDLDGDGAPDFDADTDVDADGDTPDAGLSVFTFRGIVAMLCIMGWSGLVFLNPLLGIHKILGFLITFALGALTLVLVALAMKGIYKLQQSGNLDLHNAIGKVGQVYLTVPQNGKGSGKVSLTVQDQYKEFTAITAAEEPIKTGAYVRVVSLSEAGVLVVEPINK